MTEGSQMENGEWKMENEIFIDDCNVCKCEYYYDLECKLYKNESSEPEDTTYDFCKEHPLCEYKATAILERLEQENKELKEKVKKLDKMTGIFSARFCDSYRSALEEIRILATKNVSIENFVKIQNKINEVLNHSEG